MDMIGMYLRDELMGEGCPLCRVLQKFEDSQIDTILYERANDPEVREHFKKSLGLCPYHAWRVLERAYSESLLDPLSVAVIYEHMLRTYMASLEKDDQEKEGECYLCQLVREKERMTVKSFVDRIEELLPVYAGSKSLLCRRHYRLVMEELTRAKPELAPKLKEIQLEKLRRLQGLISGFIEKSDYRHEEGPGEDEEKAIKGTIEALKGLPLSVNNSQCSSKKPGKIIRRGVRRGWKV